MKKITIILVIFLVAQALFFAFWLQKIKKQPVKIIVDTISVDTIDADTLLLQKKTAFRLSEQSLMATLFLQKSAEYRALCYQAFSAARFMLEADLKDQTVNSPRAIVVDIDETMLDNSPHSAKCILEGTSYPDYWEEWCELANAETVPGAVEFLNHARRFGVSIFYITNRMAHLREVTMNNLRKLGFPQVDEKHMMFRTDVSSKEKRRQDVLRTYHISMLIGDNLADFAEVFERKTIEKRAAVTDSLSQFFGRRYIVLPNPMYGDWEGALYDYDFSISDSAKIALRRNLLESF